MDDIQGFIDELISINNSTGFFKDIEVKKTNNGFSEIMMVNFQLHNGKKVYATYSYDVDSRIDSRNQAKHFYLSVAKDIVNHDVADK